MKFFPYSKQSFPFAEILDWLKKQKTFVFLETTRLDAQNRFSYIFTNPVDIISCYKPNEIKDAFRQIKEHLNNNHYATGFFSYEMGYGFENLYKTKKSYKFPLLWLGIFKSAIVFDHYTNKFLNKPPSFLKEIKPQLTDYKINNLKLNVNQKSYFDSIGKIKKLLKQGDTYEVNYTMKYKFDFKGSPYQLYHTLRNNQSVAYSAFIKTEDFKILSFSPELFFRKKGKNIQTKPMKGTIERGRDLKEDALNKNGLNRDEKNRAENLMIVDLLRNDLGRISEIDSVKVEDIFCVEKYETLFQMTSTIKSILKKDIGYYDLFKSLFPSGSVSGAPKIRTMQIIKKIEKEERGVYTGAIGLFKPDGKAMFNVAIRTILLEPVGLRGAKGEMGIGSGIVYDSEPEQEYKECLLKANFLVGPQKEFQLIETILWSKKFFLLESHLKRLRESAKYFDFCYNENYIKKALLQVKKRFKPNFSYRVRLLLFKNGDVSITYRCQKEKSVLRQIVAISEQKTNSKDNFLYYKTTFRQLYDKEYQKYKKLGYYDVLFRNERNEITEGAISNIFIKVKGKYWTPPISCGLLNGVYRKYFLDKKKDVQEKILTLEDIQNADEIYLTNSVRKMVKVKLDKFE